MTEVEGSIKQVGQGLTQKTFKYDALGALIDIVFNTAGQVVQAVVQKPKGGNGGGSSTARPSPTPGPVSLPVSSAAPSSAA